MKLLSLFSGIGAFEKALTNQNIPFELVNYCEFDKYASKAYSLIHNVSELLNLGDITKINVDSLPEVNMITYGFPCQDISLAGNMKGFTDEDGNKTRSGLFFDALDIITHTHPKVAIAENVKNLTSKRFRNQFNIVLNSLEESGYNNYWQVLKSSDYGVPQKRQRLFIVSIKKDIDTGVFEFPKPFRLKTNLASLLENHVESKYYISEKMKAYAFNMIKEAKGIGFSDSVDKSFINPEIAQTIGCRSAKGQRSGTTNYVSDSKESMLVSDLKRSGKLESMTDIRNLTEKECFRLQGFSDSDVEKLFGEIPSGQIYKMAGNSITVDVLEELFCMMFDENGDLYL